MPLFTTRKDPAAARLPQQIYLPRIAGLGLGGIGIAVALSERQAPDWLWMLVFCGALVWPHVAYQLSSRSMRPDKVEKRNLLVDAALASIGVYAIGGSLVPSAVALTIIGMNNLAVGGWRLWLRGLGACAAGAAAAALLLPWTFAPDSSLRVQVACLPVLALYFPAFGWTLLKLARRLHRTNEAVRRLSREDPLSGVHNRRSFGDELARVFATLRQSNEAASPKAALVLFDIDHFKSINDEGGHAAGDAVIRLVGQVLRANLPRHDLAARYGGDEFVVLLAGAGPAEAVDFMKRLQADLRRSGKALRDSLGGTLIDMGASPPMSVSTGIAGYYDDLASPDDWIARADAALYVVKRRSRGGIEVAPH